MQLICADEPRLIVEALLGPGEKLLWAGRPPAGIIVRPSDALVIPFSVMWAGFACFWEYSVIADKAPVFFSLWGIPFVLAGLYFVVGRFLVDQKQREKTAYGVTNERVIIVSGVFSQSVKSLNLRTLSDVTMNERADGTGIISFGPSKQYWMNGMGWRPGISPTPAFERIPDVKAVYDTIRAAGRGIIGRA